jgi:hypothetical protein
MGFAEQHDQLISLIRSVNGVIDAIEIEIKSAHRVIISRDGSLGSVGSTGSIGTSLIVLKMSPILCVVAARL